MFFKANNPEIDVSKKLHEQSAAIQERSLNAMVR